jgi:hypothetical protein
MKKTVFKYFDTFCYGELINPDDDNPSWFRANIDCDGFGYSTDTDTLYYHGVLKGEVCSMFGIGQSEFRKYFSEWFEGRYNLRVLTVL